MPYRSCKSKIWLCSCFINSVYVWVPMRITHSIKYQVSRRDYVLTVQPQVCWWMLLNTGKVISTRMSTFLTQQNSTISTTIQWLIYINTTDKLPFTVVFTYVPCALIIIIIIIIIIIYNNKYNYFKNKILKEEIESKSRLCKQHEKLLTT